MSDRLMECSDKKNLYVARYAVRDLIPYIDWMYFFHAWGFPPKLAAVANIHGCDACRASWLAGLEPEERGRGASAMQLYKEAVRMLDMLDADYGVNCEFRLFSANSDGDDILVEGTRIPMLRQQIPGSDGYCLCLSDFIRPVASGIEDKIGVFATAVDAEMELLYENDDYRRMLVQTLADRLAEACAEKLHECVRKSLWGYAEDEDFTPAELLACKYTGIRPAVGYPCLPDISLNFILDELLDFSRIGISLTENGMMRPHASVSGFVISHPKSRYFSVGAIDDEQLRDYSARRGVKPEEMKRFLASILR